ncbi:hypothetical protein DYB28_000276 [Aphanomyces astaci]|uniref:START domain-containing protein n=1 Tax=Aphanomyces astaci TaxID=112090 RepID=A0A397FG02_APHAT|nr:hypothetical protein DYB36_005660 [Aphanomyces astaci]RHY36144.1 hypothetical protein DYB38_008967 [Aphanomyces astaci]RHY37750.1 hypothetical protein DYB25_007457 [Aphanomyces astaci]RHY45775.1 hypothetical protein DYB34_010856 [Aphanomyces astaci]RHY56640.1 hypothetical protein DYB30_001749 [Aphanomyces astaci]
MSSSPVVSPMAKKRRLEIRRSKKGSQKQKLLFLQRRVYDLEGVLDKAKRNFSTLLPWEEVAKALQDDTLDQVRDNRSLKRQVEVQSCMYQVLHAWVVSMRPPEKLLDAHVDTWRHSHLLSGDAETRRMAQSWIVQHAFFNRDRSMARMYFPDDTADPVMEAEVDVTDDLQFNIMAMSQCVVPYSLDEVSEAAWIADNHFPTHRHLPRLPPADDLRRLTQGDVRYGCDDEVIVPIRKQCLHGKFHEPDRTTIVFRTILHDDDAPAPAPDQWIVDMQEWTVVEHVGPRTTRVRSLYQIGHPVSQNGPASVAAVGRAVGASAFDAATVRRRIEWMHLQQRQVFLDHLDRVLVCLHGRR